MRDKLCLCGVVAALVLSVGLLAAAPAQASTPPDRLTTLTISIWLEYDRPGALCIMSGELPKDAPLPARLTFRLPREPRSTAGIDAEGKFRYIRPVVTQDKGATVVTYEVTWPRFQVEYYDVTLQKEGTARELDFLYRADYPIEQLVLAVKEPYGAGDLTLAPGAQSESQGEDGLTEYRRTIGAVAPGQEVRWRVNYTKKDPRLASEALGLPTAMPSPYESAASQPARPAGQWTAWALVGIFGLTVFGGLGVVLSVGSRPAKKPVFAVRPASSAKRAGAKATAKAKAPAKAAARPAKATAKPAKGKAKPPAARVRLAKYCHECGAPLSKDHAYCRKCGTRRRGI